MGEVTYNQTLKILAGRTPTTGTNITEKNFEINPAETFSTSNLNEVLSHRFSIEDGVVDDALCKGTIDLIKILVFRPDADLETKLVNASGTSQNFTFLANKTSVLHVELTEVLVSNSTGSPIRGIFFVAGD